MTGTSNVNSSSLGLSRLDVSHDSVVLKLGSLGSLESLSRERVSNLEGVDLLGEEVEEFVVDSLLDVDPRSGTAALSVVEEQSEGGPRDGLLEVGVVEDNVGRLSSELESHVLEVGRSGGLHDDTSDEGRSSEGELVESRVRKREGDAKEGELNEPSQSSCARRWQLRRRLRIRR